MFTLFFLYFTALKIHISEPTTNILLQIGGFELDERGFIDIKASTTMNYLNLLNSSRQHVNIEQMK